VTPPRPRFTSRAAVLVLVLAVLTVSYASSMRAYLQQRREIDSMRAEISTSQASITSLQREKRRWNDATYIKTIAHQRLGWVMPGEIGFQVIDDNGKPLGHTDSLSDPTSVATANRPLWWQAAWGSVVSAGKPPPDAATAPTPATRIKVPTGSKPNGQAR